MSNREACPRGCFRFSDLPIDAYFRRCGQITLNRIARGEPVGGYKKVNERGSVLMLLKARGWPTVKVGGRSGKYVPVTKNSCVFPLGREWATRTMEQRARFEAEKEAAEQRRRKAG